MNLRIDHYIHWAPDLSQLNELLTEIKFAKEQILSAISDFATAQNSFNDQIDIAITGLQGDVAFLVAEIARIQGSPGPISAEDQASLDALQSRTNQILAKLQALDALTPPVPPVA